MPNDKITFATKDDVIALSHQIDESTKGFVTKKDLKISLFEFAKEYKLEWMNVKINFILWLIGAGIPACLGYLFYKLEGVNHILFQIIERLPK